MDIKLADLVLSLPKAELHIHIEGAINPVTSLKLAHKYSHLGFVDDVNRLQKSVSFNNFIDFHSYYQICSQLIRSVDDFSLVAYECGQDMHNQSIRYREVHISIYQHLNVFGKKLGLRDVLVGLQDGCNKAKDDFGVEIKWIFGIPRRRHFSGQNPSSFDPTIANTVLDYAVQGQEFGVIGIGLGGNEIDAPPQPFKEVFLKAKQLGLHRIPHAGETEGPNSVWGAINDLQADRICHGVRSIEDKSLVNEIIDRKIPLDICPTSNISINIYPSMKEHPFYELDKLGAKVTINSDDPSIFGNSLCDEYILLAEEFGYSIFDLVRFAKNSFQVSFAPREFKNKHLLEIDRWCELNLSDTLNNTA